MMLLDEVYTYFGARRGSGMTLAEAVALVYQARQKGMTFYSNYSIGNFGFYRPTMHDSPKERFSHLRAYLESLPDKI